jgi:hypothetical protein
MIVREDHYYFQELVHSNKSSSLERTKLLWLNKYWHWELPWDERKVGWWESLLVEWWDEKLGKNSVVWKEQPLVASLDEKWVGQWVDQREWSLGRRTVGQWALYWAEKTVPSMDSQWVEWMGTRKVVQLAIQLVQSMVDYLESSSESLLVVRKEEETVGKKELMSAGRSGRNWEQSKEQKTVVQSGINWIESKEHRSEQPWDREKVVKMGNQLDS